MVLFSTVAACVVFLLLRQEREPRIYLWAWERPEDLRFLETSKEKVTVVYYAGDVVIQNGQMEIQSRRNSLSLPSGIKKIPVVRIDNFGNAGMLDGGRIKDIADFIIFQCSQADISGCQIDFDASVLEREKYKQLVADIKSKIPSNIQLSITALVSWCHTFSWLDELDIVFAVPMFYRMGPDATLIRSGNVGETFMKAKKCKRAIGVSTDEPVPDKKFLRDRDIYLFNPEPWTKESFDAEVKRVSVV